MKTLCLLPLALFALVAPVHAGPANGAKEADKKTSLSASTNLLDVAIPQGVFCMTNGPVKDPFFPNSTRTQIKVATTTAPTPISKDEFRITGLSGLPGQRLALINNHNFAEGESAIVATPIRKVSIKVIQIREYSAIIRVAGSDAPYEVFLAANLR
jgi:hypothetical protein